MTGFLITVLTLIATDFSEIHVYEHVLKQERLNWLFAGLLLLLIVNIGLIGLLLFPPRNEKYIKKLLKSIEDKGESFDDRVEREAKRFENYFIMVTYADILGTSTLLLAFIFETERDFFIALSLIVIFSLVLFRGELGKRGLRFI